MLVLVRVFLVFVVDCGQRQGFVFFCFQAEDGIRDLVRSRGLGDVYKRQVQREQGLTPREAIFQACLLRFRPIMMTTMAALLGLSLIHI